MIYSVGRRDIMENAIGNCKLNDVSREKKVKAILDRDRINTDQKEQTFRNIKVHEIFE